MKNRLYSWFVVILMAFTLSSGIAFAEGQQEAEDTIEKPYIAVVAKGFQHQFWQCVKDGAEQAAKDYDVDITFEGPKSESEIVQQVDMLNVAIDKKPDAICLAALDSKAVVPQLIKANEESIPVLGFDSGVDSDIVATTCATDNYAASALAGEKMIELIGTDAGKVAILSFSQTAKSGADRRDGFVDKLREEAPNIEVIVEYSNGDTLKAIEITKAILTANPDIKGLFGLAGNDVNGILNAVKELGMEGKVTIIGFDAGKQQIDAVRSGFQAGAITQDPIGMGYKTIESALRIINGETLPKTIDTGFYWYDKTNMDSDTISPLLYE